MTLHNAYLIVFDFLNNFFFRARRENDSFASLLSDMDPYLFGDNQMPADPAVWSDWEMCVKKVCSSDNDIRPEELKPLMFTFLNYYMSEFGFELEDVIAALQSDPDLDLKLNTN